MNLNETNRVLLTESLSDLLLLIQEGIPHFSHVSAKDINENTLAIASAKIKLERIPREKTQQFSAQEMKVMYWAVKNFRDDTQEFLDSLSPSDPDRNMEVFDPIALPKGRSSWSAEALTSGNSSFRPLFL